MGISIIGRAPLPPIIYWGSSPDQFCAYSYATTSSVIAAARAAGADTFVSGEISYHHMADAPEEGMNLIAAGHFFTEFPVCQKLAELIREADSEIECEIFFNNKVKYI